MIIGSSVIHHEKVTSTNTVALSLASPEKAAEGTVITASFQEGGRGQKGNSWESEAGKNILMSVILYPTMIRPEGQFVISRMVSLAVCDLVSTMVPATRIKWPNDIYAGHDKIAGILIENSVMGGTLCSTVAGIGLNVNQKTFMSGAPNPVSLAQLTGMEHDLNGIRDELIRLLDIRYQMVVSGAHEKLSDDYHRLLYRRGEWHRYSDAEGEFTGMIDCVKDSGLISIRRENGLTNDYAFKEVDYIL
jgi:BirA family biotin operon repressor/biotin-[acetyl-CoA-carboxylase] ligase